MRIMLDGLQKNTISFGRVTVSSFDANDHKVLDELKRHFPEDTTIDNPSDRIDKKNKYLYSLDINGKDLPAELLIHHSLACAGFHPVIDPRYTDVTKIPKNHVEERVKAGRRILDQMG